MVKTYHILHFDDDAHWRDVVERALGLDPSFLLLTCENGEEALSVASDWAPDVILSDPQAPSMDGAALLARLRDNPATSGFPVVFLAMRARPEDGAGLKALGAAAVITAPFDPPRIAECVRRHLLTIKLNAAGYDFAQRLRRDAATLAAFRPRLGQEPAPDELKSLVHKLAGAAGVFNFAAVSAAAAALEDAIIGARDGRCAAHTVAANFDSLLASIAQA
jgi:CheY-like chemotaxis protein